MAEKDLSEKLLEEYDDVFADIVNVLLFDGKREVKEEELAETGTESQYKADDSVLHAQERDVAKYWKKGKIRLALYGLENQTTIDSKMPMRILNYDGMSYRSQLLKDDNEVYPVITLVLYFGTKRKWKKPLSLYEVFSVPEELKEYINDYKINVFNIAYLSEEQVNMFTSDFKIVADYFVQRRKNNGKYKPSSDVIRHVDAILKFMAVFTGDQRYFNEAIQKKMQAGGIRTMDKVIDDYIDLGVQRGIKQGIDRGRQEGRLEERTALIRSLCKKKSPEEIADLLEIPVEEVLEIIKE